jgi:hypothetical protein
MQGTNGSDKYFLHFKTMGHSQIDYSEELDIIKKYLESFDLNYDIEVDIKVVKKSGVK